MIRNYLTVALRNLSKHKLFAVIHTVGLSLAFAVSIMLYLAAMFEFSYDEFHTKKDRLFQVYFESNPPEGKVESAALPVPFAPAAKEELKGIVNVSRYGDNGGALIRYQGKELGLTTRFVDPSFLEMFSFPLAEGDEASALSELNGLVLSEHSAKNIFGDAPAIGKEVELNVEGYWEPYVVTGIAEDFPNNSSIRFDAFARFEKFSGYRGNTDIWDTHNHGAFIELADQVEAADFERDAASFVEKHFKADIDILKAQGAQADENGVYKALKLMPLTGVHFFAEGIGGQSTKPLYPWILLVISILVLFIASTNFINLSLANSFIRSKEIAMRKTLGASKSQLLLQFWTEAFWICFISLLIGSLLAWTLLPSFNSLLGYSLSIGHLFSFVNLGLLLIFFLLITIVAGGYPAFVMAGFNSIQILKGKIRLSSKSGLRNALSVGQFAVAIFLIIATLTVIRQINYMQRMPLGYSVSAVISIPIGNSMGRESAVSRMRTALAAMPDVEAVSASDVNMGMGRDNARSRTGIGFNFEGKNVVTDVIRVDYDYLSTMQIELLEGRDFSRSYTTDTASVLINEEMAALLGGKEAVGKVLPMNGRQFRVIGVVKSFNTQTLHEKIAPLTMHIDPAESAVNYIFVRVSPRDLGSAIAHVEKVWKEVNPKANVAASFLSENTQRMYEKEKRFSVIIVSGAVLAVLISCMGLFALALLLMNQRVKEIGVRKVLGAHVSSIVYLLSKDFILMVGIAFLIAAPIAWWLMGDWLNGFAFRIELDVQTLLTGGVVVLLVALATVVSQSLKAALTNPVKSLRAE
jgi:putative ABC transport system permease protein